MRHRCTVVVLMIKKKMARTAVIKNFCHYPSLIRRDIYPTTWLLTALRLTVCSFKFVHNRCCRLQSEYRFHNNFVLKRSKINGRQGFLITPTKMLSSKGNLTKMFYPFPDKLLSFCLNCNNWVVPQEAVGLCCWGSGEQNLIIIIISRD